MPNHNTQVQLHFISSVFKFIMVKTILTRGDQSVSWLLRQNAEYALDMLPVHHRDNTEANNHARPHLLLGSIQSHQLTNMNDFGKLEEARVPGENPISLLHNIINYILIYIIIINRYVGGVPGENPHISQGEQANSPQTGHS